MLIIFLLNLLTFLQINGRSWILVIIPISDLQQSSADFSVLCRGQEKDLGRRTDPEEKKRWMRNKETRERKLAQINKELGRRLTY